MRRMVGQADEQVWNCGAPQHAIPNGGGALHRATQALNTKFQIKYHSTFLQEDGSPAPDRLREVLRR